MKNTKYFHAIVEGRRRRNTISALQKSGGAWCKSGEEIEGYFKSLFTFSNPQHFDIVLEGVPQVITRQMNQRLVRPVSEKEVRKAIFSLHP